MACNKKKIFFRADAGAEIGYGHFIRTLALSDMLKDDFDCIFFTQSPTDYQKQEIEKVCSLVALPADDSKFDIFISYLRGDEIVILDNYYFSTDYQRQIKRKGCKLVCIDDVHDKHFFADLVICPDPCSIEDYSLEPFTIFRGGLEWSLLRRSFVENSNTYYTSNSKTIVISFGGSDYYNLTQKTLNYLSSLRNFVIHIVSNRELQYSIANNDVIVHCGLSSDEIVSLFKSSSIAILSASSICSEALAIGIPVIAGYYVDNQVQYYNYLKREGYILPLGNLLEESYGNLLLHYIESNKVSRHLNIDFKQQRISLKDLFQQL